MDFIVKIITSLCILSSIAFGCDVNWQNSLAEAKSISAKTKKPILVFISSITCPYCTKMSNETFSDSKVCTAINNGFVPLAVLEGSPDMPRGIKVRGVPNIAFVDSKEKEIAARVTGFRNTNEFLSDLEQRFKGVGK